MSASGSHSNRGAIGAAIGVIVVVVIIIIGFVVAVPETSAVGVPVVQSYVASSVSQYQTSTISQEPIAEQTTTNQPIFDIGTNLLVHGYYDYSTANLPAGADVQLSWTTDNSVNVFVFTSSEYSAFTGSGTTSPNVVSKTGTSSDSMSFIVSAPDTYYLVLQNTNNGLLFGYGAKNDTVSSSGTASYNVETTVYVAQTNTFITSTTIYTTITTTSTSTTTTTCSVALLKMLIGAKC